MDIIDKAVYDLVHNFSRGREKGAPALSTYLLSQYNYSIRPGTLMNKANPDQEHQFTVREGVMLQRIQQKFNLLHAEAHVLNHSVVPLGDYSTTSDLEFLNQYTELHKELGALAGVIRDAFKDGVIDRTEVREVRTCAMACIRALLELESRIKGMCEERLPEDLFYE